MSKRPIQAAEKLPVTAVSMPAGRTSFATEVVETIAGVAAREVQGVYKLGRGALKDAAAKIVGTIDTTRGVSVEVGETQAAVDLELMVLYGTNIHRLASEVRELVGRRIFEMTGLETTEVNVDIVGIHFDQPEVRPSRRVQ